MRKRDGRTIPAIRGTRISKQAPQRGGGTLLSRQEIIDSMINALKPLDYVHAFWEGGAAAHGRADEWSDIDAYLLVADSKAEDTFLAVEKALESLSPIKQKYVVENNWPGLTQAFYSLERASEYLLIDLAILTESSPEKYLEPEIHGTSIFYFNKPGIIETPSLDKHKFESKVEARSRILKERFRMFSGFVQKEINRGNSLEAMEYYRTIVIPSLVESLRMKYHPARYDFKMRYVHYELPPDIVRKLEELCFVRGIKDLQEKYLRALRWFNRTMTEIQGTRKLT
jgi:predicted nucleotidyltransferase